MLLAACAPARVAKLECSNFQLASLAADAGINVRANHVFRFFNSSGLARLVAMLPVRRISSGLRELRWGHVFVEFTMLVLGIVLALAFNNWMEDRRDARVERQYLELLLRDLDRTLQTLQEFVTFEDAQAADGAAAYRTLTSGETLADREAVAQALSNLTVRRTLRITKATYTNLIGTGDIRLITNVGLRDRIIGLYEESDRYAAIVDRNNQVFVDQMFAMYVLDHAIVATRARENLPAVGRSDEAFIETIGPTSVRPRDRIWQIKPGTLEWDVLIGKLWERTQVSVQAAAMTRSEIELVGGVKTAVEAELARRWQGSGSGQTSGAKPASR
jgi:hypothetical protein